MTDQIASGRVRLETLLELCGDIPGLAVRVVHQAAEEAEEVR